MPLQSQAGYMYDEVGEVGRVGVEEPVLGSLEGAVMLYITSHIVSNTHPQFGCYPQAYIHITSIFCIELCGHSLTGSMVARTGPHSSYLWRLQLPSPTPLQPPSACSQKSLKLESIARKHGVDSSQDGPFPDRQES